MKDHLDQIICGFVLTVVGLTLAIGWQSGAGRFQRSVPAAEEITARLLERQNESPDEAKARFQKSDVSRVLVGVSEDRQQIESAWTMSGSTKPVSDGVFYHLATLSDLRDGRDLVMRFLPPRDVVAASSIGSVHLQWRADPGNTVNVVGFRILRRTQSGEFAEVAEVTETASGWLDKGVQAGVEYFYVVSSLTDERVLVEQGTVESRPSPPVHVVGKVDYEIHPIAYDSARRTLKVSIRKFVAGVWHERAFDIKTGQMVGARDAGSGVDFTTGCLTQGIEATPEIVVKTTQDVVLDEKGHVVVESGKPLGRERKSERKGLSVVALLQTRGGRILRIEHRQ